MKKFYFLFVAAVFFALMANSQTATLTPVKDNSIFQNLPLNSNGAGINFHSGRTNGSNSPRRALIKFDIAAAVPAGSIITSVTLTLTLNRTNSGAQVVALHRLNADWGEGTSDGGPTNDGDGSAATINDATWPCSFSNGAGGCITTWTAGGNFDATASATSSVGALGPYTWTSAQMIADVQNWLTTPVANFGWIIIGNESTNLTAKRFASKDNAVVTERPQLSIQYTSGLPVTLLHFKARETKNGILLNWETAQEFNNDFFSIEHSLDGIHFTSLGRVNGNGTSSLHHLYHFLHEGIEAGRHYYRLAQTDIDSKVNYSNVVSLNSRNRYFSLLVNPNPVNDEISLQGSANWAGSSYVIITQTGAVALSGSLTSSHINVISLPNSVYYIRVTKTGGVMLSGKFLKN